MNPNARKKGGKEGSPEGVEKKKDGAKIHSFREDKNDGLMIRSFPW
jgi:hypothetical protein